MSLESTKKARRIPPNVWKPGQSGNPGGRPKALAAVREYARQFTTEAIDHLVAIMRNKKTLAHTRVAACREILDRGVGKSTAHLELSTPDNKPLQLQHASTDDLTRLVALAREILPDDLSSIDNDDSPSAH